MEVPAAKSDYVGTATKAPSVGGGSPIPNPAIPRALMLDPDPKKNARMDAIFSGGLATTNTISTGSSLRSPSRSAALGHITTTCLPRGGFYLATCVGPVQVISRGGGGGL